MCTLESAAVVGVGVALVPVAALPKRAHRRMVVNMLVVRLLVGIGKLES